MTHGPTRRSGNGIRSADSGASFSAGERCKESVFISTKLVEKGTDSYWFKQRRTR